MGPVPLPLKCLEPDKISPAALIGLLQQYSLDSNKFISHLLSAVQNKEPIVEVNQRVIRRKRSRNTGLLVLRMKLNRGTKKVERWPVVKNKNWKSKLKKQSLKPFKKMGRKI